MGNCYTCKYLLAGYSGDGWNEPREFEMDCKLLETVSTAEAEDMILKAMDLTYDDKENNKCKFYDAGECFTCGKPIGKSRVFEVMGYYENHNTCSKECYEVGTKKEREYVREMMG